MDWIELVGYAAGTLTTASFAPQAWRVIKLRETNAISLPMYVIFTAGVAMWILYGVLLGYLPMIIPNVITLALALMILVTKIRYG